MNKKHELICCLLSVLQVILEIEHANDFIFPIKFIEAFISIMLNVFVRG